MDAPMQPSNVSESMAKTGGRVTSLFYKEIDSTLEQFMDKKMPVPFDEKEDGLETLGKATVRHNCPPVKPHLGARLISFPRHRSQLSPILAARLAQVGPPCRMKSRPRKGGLYPGRHLGQRPLVSIPSNLLRYRQSSKLIFPYGLKCRKIEGAIFPFPPFICRRCNMPQTKGKLFPLWELDSKPDQPPIYPVQLHRIE